MHAVIPIPFDLDPPRPDDDESKYYPRFSPPKGLVLTYRNSGPELAFSYPLLAYLELSPSTLQALPSKAHVCPPFNLIPHHLQETISLSLSSRFFRPTKRSLLISVCIPSAILPLWSSLPTDSQRLYLDLDLPLPFLPRRQFRFSPSYLLLFRDFALARLRSSSSVTVRECQGGPAGDGGCQARPRKGSKSRRE